MEWSKLKNVILLMLVCVNLILLLLVGSQASRNFRYQEDTRQAAQAVLEQGGIAFEPERFPDDLSLPVLTVTRDRSDEADVAAALLGQVSLQGQSEVRPRYSGPGGTAEFSMNGSFTVVLQPGTWTRESGQSYEAASQACLDAIGPVQKDSEELDLTKTLSVYLLDGEMSVTLTSELLYVHKNTVKYRIRRISNLLGYKMGKMPELLDLYKACAVRRLMED